MTLRLARIIMALTTCCLGHARSEWSAAMTAEFEAATADGQPLSFAVGCLAAALRDMVAREHGCLTLSGYALAIGVMIPMAAVQLGCALFGLPYLYPGGHGLPGAMLEGAEHLRHLRGLYQAAVPSLTLLLALLAAGHLRIAWAMLDCDWARVTRFAGMTLACAVTLVMLMSVLFLDAAQAMMQTAVLAIELGTVTLLARRHSALRHATGHEPPG